MKNIRNIALMAVVLLFVGFAFVTLIMTGSGKPEITSHTSTATATKDTGAPAEGEKPEIVKAGEALAKSLEGAEIVGPVNSLARYLGGERRVCGRIVDAESKKPVKGALIESHLLLEQLPAWHPEYASIRTVAGEDGRFEISGLSEKFYPDLWVSAEGYMKKSVDSFDDEKKTEMDLGDVELEKGVMCAFEVRDAETGDPVKRAYVAFSDETFFYHNPFKTTDSSGKCVFHLKNGIYTIQVRAEGYIETEKSITVESAPLSLVLKMEKGLEISGTVMDEEGEPLEGVSVRAAGFFQSIEGFDTSRLSSRTDADGRFAVREALREIKYHLYFSKEKYGGYEIKDVTAPKKDIRVTLPNAFIMSGLAKDARSDKILPGERLTFKAFGNEKELSSEYTKSKEDGTYEVFLPRGLDTVKVSGGDGIYEKSTVTIDIPDNCSDSMEMDIALDAGNVLTGRVTDRKTGKPVEFAHINIRLKDKAEFEDARYGYTDEKGVYEFGNLESGEYKYYLQHSNYISKTSYFSDSVQTLVVGEGITKHDFEIGGGAEIYGKVTLKDGTPLKSARISIGSDGEWGFNHDAVASVEEDGSYFLRGLEAAREYMARAEVEGLKMSETTFTLSEGESKEINFVLEEGASIAGRVTNSNGDPIRGVNVWFSRTDVEKAERERSGFGFRGYGGFGEGTWSETGGNGTYLVSGLESGTYLVMARKDGYRPEVRKDVQVGLEKVEGIDFTLDEGLSVSGRVVDTDGNGVQGIRVAGRSEGSETLPQSPRKIRENIEDISEFLNRGPASSDTKTDNGGYYKMTGFNEGDVGVWIYPEPDYHCDSNHLNVKAGATDVNFTVKKNGTLKGRLVGLDKFTSFNITAQTKTDKTGEGDTTQPPYERFRNSINKYFQNAEGKFEMKLPEGEYTLSASGEGFAGSEMVEAAVTLSGEPQEVVIKVNKGGSVAVTVVAKSNGKPLEGASVSVTPDLSGMSGSRSIRTFEGMYRNSQTDSDGRALLTGIAAGNFKVEVSHPMYANPKPRSVAITEDATTEITIELSEGSKIFGVVTDHAGNTVKGCSVAATSAEDMGMMGRPDGANAKTADNGSYVLAGLAPGQYNVMVLKDQGERSFMSGGARASKTVTVPQDGSVRCDFKLKPVVKVFGTISGGDKRVRGHQLVFIPLSGDSAGGMGALFGSGNVETDENGNYETTLAPGKYKVMIMSGGFGGKQSATEVDVPEVPEFRFDYQFSTSSVSGRILMPDGTPASGAIVGLMKQEVNDGAEKKDDNSFGAMLEAFVGQVMTDQNGEFSLDSVEPGTYTLIIRKEGYAVVRRENVVVTEGGGLENIEVALEEGGSLVVNVTDEAGKPLGDVVVFAAPDKGDFNMKKFMQSALSGTMTEAGVYTVKGLETGAYVLYVLAGGYGQVGMKTSYAGGEAAISVVLKKPGTAAFSISAGGQPLSGARVTVKNSAGVPVLMGGFFAMIPGGAGGDTTDASGNLALKLAPGSYAAVVTAENCSTEETSFTVQAGKETKAEVSLVK